MAIFQKIVDFDELFYQLKTVPMFINDINITTDQDIENIKDLITTTYTSDVISLIPSCKCGMTKGKYIIGMKCFSCKTIVTSSLTEDIEPTLWFRQPDGVEKLINPIVLNMLRARFKNRISIIDWLIDVNFRTNKVLPRTITQLQEMNIGRGYNNFVHNFDKIMEVLFSMSKVKKGTKDYLYMLIQECRNHIFNKYIPIPNRSLLIFQNTNVGKFVKNDIVKGKNAILTLASIESQYTNLTPRMKENRTARGLLLLCDFYNSYLVANFSPKLGLFRKHIMSTRTHFSARAVITSLTEPHDYDEIFIPWGIGVTLLRYHLLSKLLSRGYILNDAINLLYSHVHVYNELLDNLFKEIIAESKTGLYCTFNRNPSLWSGSILKLRITKVKTKVEDKTISFSILCVKPPNADFDGDEMNLSLCLDDKMSDMMEPLAPHNTIFIPKTPRVLSDNMSIPKPVIATISNWLSSDD